MFRVRAILLLASAGWTRAEQPVGLVLSPGGSKLLRANTETPLAARAGDLLFSGDGLRTGASTVSFLFCPAQSVDTLSASSEVRFDTKQPRIKSGRIVEQPARGCLLPESLRVEIASQQHYGGTITRGVRRAGDLIPRNRLAADVLAELPPADSKDPGDLVVAATVFEKHQLVANALDVYYQLQAQWPDAVWIKSKIFRLEQQLSSPTAPQPSTGQTYALLVGITKYKRKELSLQFAEADATMFSKFFQTARGGAIPAENILLLTDEKATTAAIRSGFNDFLKRRAQKNDTVQIVIAGHGTVDDHQAYIVTYDSDPDDLVDTALPMAELRTLFEDQLKNVGRVIMFADVCRAGTIGSIHSAAVNSGVYSFGEAKGDLFGFLASRPNELSFEGSQFGGGHGAFSYYVMRGLEGAADENGDSTVDLNELIEYVSREVPHSTAGKQHPREFGVFNNMTLSDIHKPGIGLAHFRILLDPKRGGPLYFASQSPDFAGSENLTRFTEAIAGGRLLPDQPQNAFDALKALATQVTPNRLIEVSNQLRVALENRAQEILLRYLAGDQNSPPRADFELGARYIQAARMLTKESLFLESREDFFTGRALLFNQKFDDATERIEQSIRLDPGGAYAYNALGIAYLEQARFNEAIPAFRDAFRRAPHWTYPLHNQALACIQTGEYDLAIRLYQQAMRLTPQYSYLPYNLGLLYQRLNRRSDAEAAYRKALKLSPDTPEAYNALGTLKASEGKSAEAEQLYRDALSRRADLKPARHNLALLLARDAKGRPEAIQLLRANFPYLPSEVTLAEILADAGDRAGAIAQYRQVLAKRPGYTAARLALAKLLDPEGALEQLRMVIASDPENVIALEQTGDLESSRGNIAQAREAFAAAIAAAPDRATKKEIEKKMKALVRYRSAEAALP
jgi:tetratricopeptide (TPR) repeat protein